MKSEVKVGDRLACWIPIYYYNQFDLALVIRADATTNSYELAYLPHIQAAPSWRLVLTKEEIESSFVKLQEEYLSFGKQEESKCTCGSSSVGHPGHAYYCDLEKNLIA